MDMQMPVMEGHQGVKKFETVCVRTMMCSDFCDDSKYLCNGSRKRCADAGIFAKPVNLKKFERRWTRKCGRHAPDMGRINNEKFGRRGSLWIAVEPFYMYHRK